MKKLLTLTFVCCSFAALSQTGDCLVAMDSIKGTYTGACNNGKANGEGKSVGIDTYEGTFKNGLPEGKGKYTWKNGNYYFGNWKKGLKDGKGEIHLEDSVIYGFWKKDVYKGRYENPYIIHNTTSGVGKVEVNKIKGSTSSIITIEVSSMTGGGAVTTTRPSGTEGVALATTAPAVSLTDIRIQTGTYNTKAVNKLSGKEINVLQGVIFPFKATFVFGNNSVEIEILEEGEWSIQVPIQVN